MDSTRGWGLTRPSPSLSMRVVAQVGGGVASEGVLVYGEAVVVLVVALHGVVEHPAGRGAVGRGVEGLAGVGADGDGQDRVRAVDGDGLAEGGGDRDCLPGDVVAWRGGGAGDGEVGDVGGAVRELVASEHGLAGNC